MSETRMLKLARRVGIAVGGRFLSMSFVARSGKLSSLRVQLADDVEVVDYPALEAAFSLLRQETVEAGGKAALKRPLAIALLPPLVESRLVTLPPLKPGESTRILARDPRRYFLAATDERVIAATDPPKDSSAPVLATAASASFLDRLIAAASAAGLEIQKVVPAHAAWLAAAKELGASETVAVVDGTLHVLHLDEQGRPIGMRRFPAERNPRDFATAGARVLMMIPGTADSRGTPAAPTDQMPALDPAAGAALFATDAKPELVTRTLLATRSARARRSAISLAAAAMLLLIAASALELWGVQRERNEVAARRASIAPAIPALMELRDSLLAVEERRSEIRALSGTAVPVTAALVEIAVRLPADAYLSSFHAREDSLTIEAVGGRAAESLEALRRAESLRDLRLQGAVTRELTEGATAHERFTLVGRLRQAGGDPDTGNAAGNAPASAGMNGAGSPPG